MPTMEEYLYNHVEPDTKDYFMVFIDGGGKVVIHRTHPEHTHPYKLLGFLTASMYRVHQGEAIMFFEAGTPVAARVFEWLGIGNTNLNGDTGDEDEGEGEGEGEGGDEVDAVPGPEYIDPQQSKSIVASIWDRFTADLCDADYMSMYQ
jgi:hypothetical protein